MKKLIFALSLLVACVFSTVVHAQDSAPPTAPSGLKLIDPSQGMEFQAPNAMWGINAGKYSVSLNHTSFYDAHVTLKKSWYTVPTAKDAYSKRKDSLKSYLPGAEFIKENEEITMGTTPAVSMTYKNPGDRKIIREIMFVHKGVAYELVFEAKEENFQSVKEDFGSILQNIKLN